MHKDKIIFRRKAFTLVELIVVIVILAILATIAFLSFSGQSSSARDSKRKTDLSNLASKVNIGVANATSALTMISNSNPIAGAYNLAGSGIAGLTNIGQYNAGDINFNNLGVNASDFKDPQNGTYKIGATSLDGGVFQLSSKLENDDNGNSVSSGAFFVGNYSPRTAIPTGTTSITNNSGATTNVSISLASDAIGYFNPGDYVKYGASNCTVITVSASRDSVVLGNCSAPVTGINILQLQNMNEAASLIKGLSGAPADKSTNPPY